MPRGEPVCCRRSSASGSTVCAWKIATCAATLRGSGNTACDHPSQTTDEAADSGVALGSPLRGEEQPPRSGFLPGLGGRQNAPKGRRAIPGRHQLRLERIEGARAPFQYSVNEEGLSPSRGLSRAVGHGRKPTGAVVHCRSTGRGLRCASSTKLYHRLRF
jgi:hypothetical protein